MSTTTAPARAEPGARAPCWLGIGGWALALALAGAALVHAAFASAATGGAAWAARGMTNRALAAERLLFYSDAPMLPGGAPALARDALARNPLHPQAVTYMAMVAGGLGERARHDALVGQLTRLGWQDEAAQRMLYNARTLAGDGAGAMDHAEALMRQNLALDALASDFTLRLRNPASLGAWRDRVLGGERWAPRFIAQRGERLPDAALDALIDDPRGRTLLPAALVARLVEDGRPAMAGRVLAAMRGGPLVVPRWGERSDADTIGWSSGAGFSVTASGQLKRAPLPRVEAVSTLVALPPGRYRIVPADGGAAELGNWRWSLDCFGKPSGDYTLLSSPAGRGVPTECPIQKLSVTASLAAHEGEPLDRLAIVAADPAALPR